MHRTRNAEHGTNACVSRSLLLCSRAVAPRSPDMLPRRVAPASASASAKNTNTAPSSRAHPLVEPFPATPSILPPPSSPDPPCTHWHYHPPCTHWHYGTSAAGTAGLFSRPASPAVTLSRTSASGAPAGSVLTKTNLLSLYSLPPLLKAPVPGANVLVPPLMLLLTGQGLLQARPVWEVQLSPVLWTPQLQRACPHPMRPNLPPAASLHRLPLCLHHLLQPSAM